MENWPMLNIEKTEWIQDKLALNKDNFEDYISSNIIKENE